MSKLKLEGIFLPNVTPFTYEGVIDEEALRKCVKFWIKGGVSGLVPCGSTGEAPYLSREERMRVIEIVLDEARGKVPVIPGTGSMSTRETIVFTRDARDLGVEAVLVVTPFYFKLSNNEIYAHYRAVLEAVDLPIILYNVPKFTGYSLDPSVVFQLVTKFDNIVGMKDSSGSISQITEIIRLVGKEIPVLAGTADVILSTLMLGGKGAIVAVANVTSKMCVDLYAAFKEKKYGEAGRLQSQISYLNEVLIKKYNQLATIKAALNLLGLPNSYPRRPVLPLDDANKKFVEIALKMYGLVN